MIKKNYHLLTKIGLALLFLSVFVVGIQAWHPWQRQSVVFYEPIILPLETIDGDIIVMEDGSHIVLDGRRTVTLIQHRKGTVAIHSTRHLTLWELMTQ